MRDIQGADAVESYYDTKSQTYDDIFDILYFRVYDAITWKHIEPYVPADPNTLVLDAGGGTGRWTVMMAKKGCRVVLMDLSKEMLEVAAERVKKENLQDKTDIRRGDIARTGCADAMFDMVLCEHVLFLFKEPDRLIEEMNRVLKKNARLVISAQNSYVQSLSSLPERPNPANIKDALDLLLHRKYRTMTRDGKVRIYTWTPSEFRNLLERNGFHVEKIVGKGVTMPLRISKELFMKKEYPENLFKKILEFELAMCEKPEALALAGHLQAIAYKKT